MKSFARGLLAITLVVSPAAGQSMFSSGSASDSSPSTMQSLQNLQQIDRDRILEILHGFKLLPNDAGLNVLSTPIEEPTRVVPLSNPFCKIACDAAAAAAAAACASFSGPALVACLAAVEEGRKYCRSKC
ncbi:hypothetical protein [Jiella avicenniae]|uniref:Uncharacterized protein n=1 Tax=Jiella avicenniae TaxID=2907202 RepID=A0A9X1TDT5_9HYPH|nr:hypothetical protein [Jiella avicenniae]MCE7030493.1 hypothetical protein [Jiella avicenniae]